MHLLLSWLVMSVAVWATAELLPGFHVKGFRSAIMVAALFGLLNFLVGWFLFAVLAVATLGIGLLLAFLTRWLVNAILLKLTDALTDHLTIDSFAWALWGALLISVLSTLGQWLIGFAR